MNKKRKRVQKEIEIDGDTKIMSVLFVPHTEKSTLAKRMRAKLANIEKIGKLKVKIVERAGEKIVDLLHRSDAWSNRDCDREDCLICESTPEDGKKGFCRRRNVT